MKSLIDQKSDHVISKIQEMDYKWVLIGGLLLSFLGGNINVMMLSFFQVPVSHMSGAFAHLSMVYGAGIDSSNGGLSLSIVLAFFGGCILSGILIGKEAIFPGNRYSQVLFLEAFLLILACAMIQSDHPHGITFAAMACGLQNAMATTYLGLNLRTTHVSGIVTDLGLSIGHLIRGHPLNRKKTLILFSLLFGFLLGGIVAAALFQMGGKTMILFPAVLAFLIAFGYQIFRWRKWI